MLWHVSEHHSFLWITHIPLYVYTMFCLSIHLLMDTWVVFTVWISWIMLQWILVYKYLLKSPHNIFGGVYLRRIAGKYGNSTFSFLRNYHAIFLSGYTILYSHHQCTSVLVVLLSHQHSIFLKTNKFSHSSRYKVVSPGSDLHFTNG